MEDLIVSVGADITGFLSKIDAAKAKVGQLTENQGQLKDKIKDVNASLSLNEKEISKLTGNINKLNLQTRAGQREAAAFKAEIFKVATNTGVLSAELKTAQTSLLSTTTSLKVATTELKAAEAGGTGFGKGLTKAYSGLRTLANIIPGIGIGGLVGLIAGPLVDAFEKWYESTNKISNVTKLFATTLDATTNVYAKAVENVSRLKEEIQLAKQGFLNKDQVVKDYNESIGKTTGLVSSLDEAEKALNKNAEAYIKFTFLKAVANEANAESAKKAVEAALAGLKSADQFVGQGDAIGAGLKTFFLDPFSTFSENLALSGVNLSKAADKNRATIIEAGKKDSKALADIAKDYEDQAAKLSKQFNFNFFDDTKASKVKAAVETVGDVLAKMNRQIEVISQEELIFKTDKVKEKISAVHSAISHLVDKFKLTAATPLIINLELQAKDIEDRDFLRKLIFKKPDPVTVPLDFTPIKGRKPLVANEIKVVTTAMIEMQDKLKSLGITISDKAFAGISEKVLTTATLVSGVLAPAFDTFFQNLGKGGKNAFQAFGQALGQVIKEMTISVIKALALNVVISLITGKAFSVPAIVKKAITGMASGGYVDGPGTKTSDSIPARLSKGEYIIKADSVSKYGKSFFDMINGGAQPRNNRFAGGGMATGSIGGGQLITVMVEGNLKGTDLYISNKRTALKMGRDG